MALFFQRTGRDGPNGSRSAAGQNGEPLHVTAESLPISQHRLNLALAAFSRARLQGRLITRARLFAAALVAGAASFALALSCVAQKR